MPNEDKTFSGSKLCFETSSIGSPGTKIKKYSVNILLTCILYCDARPGYLIRTVCKHSALYEYHIYLRPAFLQKLGESYTFF